MECVGSEAKLSVSDTGRGISPQVLPYVFDRFRQAETMVNRTAGGLGLGLSIARHLVELHGGLIEASSEGEGRGVVAVVRLAPAELLTQRLLQDADDQPVDVVDRDRKEQQRADDPAGVSRFRPGDWWLVAHWNFTGLSSQLSPFSPRISASK